jgi:hypothetical protein
MLACSPKLQRRLISYHPTIMARSPDARLQWLMSTAVSARIHSVLPMQDLIAQPERYQRSVSV